MSRAPSAADLYGEAILREAPRVLGLMDREPCSPTRGCCDRTFWAWKFVDFPGARFQESLCVLAFLYATPLKDSPYFRNARLAEWIGYGLEFWSGRQHRDGSFDEAYPFERSLAATAFTTFYVAEALEFAGDSLGDDVRTRARDTVVRAGRWLLHNDETHGFLSNHLAAAAAALYHVYRLSGDEAFERRYRYFLDKILAHQSPEGWYEEYGGADPGYQTHGSFYLARCWQLSGDESLAESLGRAARFLAYFVHPDGSLGGEYASRNTQTYYPAAFEMLARRDGTAAWIAREMRPSVAGGEAAGLLSVDSYNYFPLLNNSVFAYLACSGGEPVAPEPPPGWDQEGLTWFPAAGLARVRRQRYDAYVGVAKGGVLKVFDRSRRRLVYSDCGYVGRMTTGRAFSSQHEDHGRGAEVRAERIRVEGSFVEIARPTMKPLTFLLFRLFTLTAGRLPGVGRALKRLLVKVLIYHKRAVDLRLTRTIEFEDGAVVVSDHIAGPAGGLVASLRCHERFTTIHMGSSRYFIRNELNESACEAAGEQFEVDPTRLAGGVELRRRITVV